jgi:hypothetical protein
MLAPLSSSVPDKDPHAKPSLSTVTCMAHAIMQGTLIVQDSHERARPGQT